MQLLVLVGAAIVLIGALWLLVVIFQTSVVWGVISLLLPFVGLIFVLMHWEVARKPFLIQLAGAALCLAGLSMLPDSSALAPP
jgi:hypothetical protein